MDNLSQEEIDEIVDRFREDALNAPEGTLWAANTLLMVVVPSLLSWITKLDDRGISPNEGLAACVICQAHMTAILTRCAHVGVSNDELTATVTRVYADVLRDQLARDALAEAEAQGSA